MPELKWDNIQPVSDEVTVMMCRGYIGVANATRGPVPDSGMISRRCQHCQRIFEAPIRPLSLKLWLYCGECR